MLDCRNWRSAQAAGLALLCSARCFGTKQKEWPNVPLAECTEPALYFLLLLSSPC